MILSHYIIIVVPFFVLSCAQSVYESSLIPKTKNQVEKNVFGSYVEVYTQDGNISGEFLCLDNDSLLVLSEHYLDRIDTKSIDSLVFYLAESKKKSLGWVGALAIVPPVLGAIIHPDYSSEFLVFSIPIGILNLSAWAAESSRKPHLVRYPHDMPQILAVQQYARFPYGLPEGLEIKNLEPKVL